MTGLPPAVLLVLYGTLALVPLALAAWSGPRENDFLAELGIGAALVAYAMLLLQFISSGRFERLSGRVGIDRTMRFHQLGARVAALLVLAHPLIPRLPAQIDQIGMVPTAMAIMFRAPHMLSGVVAWVLVLALVAMAVLRRRLPLPYEAWRATHALGAVLVALTGAHHTFSVGAYSREPALFWFWCALLGVALASIAFVYGVRPVLQARAGYRITHNREIGAGIRELTLDPLPGQGIRLRAGQFAWINLRRLPLPLFDHPFSFSSAPVDAPRLRLTIKARGDFTRRLDALAPGQRVIVDGPHGNFGLHGRPGDAVCLVAGGIGIAPIISVLRDLHTAADPRPIALLYGARNLAQLAYAEEIRAMCGRLRLHASFFLDEPPPGWTGGVGMLDAAAFRAALAPADPARWVCLICGPTPMMLAAERHLLTAGVRPDRIVYERFEYD
ncbi:MAG TPA: ferredoxin reductase family protein [Burkholderiales bacterium]|nr:ferredoxin reductase family protein [Burkholderiales bacterium]